MDSKWWKERILPGLLTLAIVNAVYAYGDVKELKLKVGGLEAMSQKVGDVKKLMCLLALNTTNDTLKKKICADQ